MMIEHADVIMKGIIHLLKQREMCVTVYQQKKIALAMIHQITQQYQQVPYAIISNGLPSK